MKILIDNKIPFLRGVLEQIPSPEPLFTEYLPGRDITPEKAATADALFIRTRTRCDASLLNESRVRFIATATIGYDHIDTQYCEQNGICWTNAPGCNAASVTQYIESVLYLLEEHAGRPLRDTTLGIVGVGHVGRLVEEQARRMGLTVLCCDPPRAQREGPATFLPLEELARRCDILTFHTPLTRQGAYPTYHLADARLLSLMPKGSTLINTSRGEVVDNPALLRSLQEGHLADVVLDVWENEPHPLPQLLECAFLGTPHIAGYSADGKANATRMSLESFCRFFHLPEAFHIQPPAPAQPLIHTTTPAQAALAIYNPRRDSEALKAAPHLFEQLREDYPLRREKAAYTFVPAE